MTPRQIHLVRTSFAALAPRADAAAALFYARLFELDPGLRPLFGGDMREQGRKLMQTIGVAVAALDRIDSLTPTLEALGARHAGFGVLDRHYEVVGSALLRALEELLGERGGSEVRDAWAAVYKTVADAMKSGVPRGPVGRPVRASTLPPQREAPNAVELYRRARQARAFLIGDLVLRAARALSRSAHRVVRALPLTGKRVPRTV